MIEEKRKVRSDKKVDVKPTIPLQHKKCLQRISFLTDHRVKDIGERICLDGLASVDVIDILSHYFRNDYWHKSTMYRGVPEKTSLQTVKLASVNERITIRFKKETNDQIKKLAFALDVTPTKATALLIDVTLKYTNFISSFIKENVTFKLDYDLVQHLRELLAYINKLSKYTYTWPTFISYLYGELRDHKIVVSEEIYH